MDDLIILLIAWLVKKIGGAAANAAKPAAPGRSAQQVPSRANPQGNPGRPGTVRSTSSGAMPAPRRSGKTPVRRGSKPFAPPPLPAPPATPAAAAASKSAPSPSRERADRAAAAAFASDSSPLAARLTPMALRRQVIINEILQPPLALRHEH
jgi:hypothetical protein